MHRLFHIFIVAAFLVLSPAALAYDLPQGVLTVGDYGEDVLALQQLLTSLGLYNEECSGTYSTHTRDAVIALQRNLGLEIDGIYGPQTAAACETALADGALVISTPSAKEDKPLTGLIIGLDPGHQTEEDPALEAMLPGSERTKPRMSPGAVGVKTGAQECTINLAVGLKLKKLLENGGATVVMTRTDNAVCLSNQERAKMMNEAGVDFWIRLHCDASSSAQNSGAHALVPSRAYNPAIYKESLALAQQVLAAFCEATGAADGGIAAYMNQTGFNWSDYPVMAIEMGYLSNAEDDVRLGLDSYQTACATGIYNGIVSYYQQAQ